MFRKSRFLSLIAFSILTCAVMLRLETSTQGTPEPTRTGTQDDPFAQIARGYAKGASTK